MGYVPPSRVRIQNLRYEMDMILNSERIARMALIFICSAMAVMIYKRGWGWDSIGPLPVFVIAITGMWIHLVVKYRRISREYTIRRVMDL
jgi:Na+/H+-dicarboxylate symporter